MRRLTRNAPISEFSTEISNPASKQSESRKFRKSEGLKPPNDPKKISQRLNLPEFGMNVLLLLLGLFSTWFIFFTLFDFPYASKIIGFVCLCGAVFSAVFFLRRFLTSPRWAWLLLGIIFLIWLFVGRRMWGSVIMTSPQVFARYIVPNLNRIVYYDFADPPVSTLVEQWNCAVFCMYWLVPYTALLSYWMLECKSRIMTLVLTIPVFAFAYALEGLPSTTMLILIFMFWMITLIKPKHHTEKFWMSHISVISSVVLSALFLIVLLGVFPPQGFKPHPKTDEVRTGLVDFAVSVENKGFFPALFGISSGSPLTSSNGTINLNNSGSIHFEDKIILRVFSDRPENMYLRGYSAAVYDGNMWEQLEEGRLSGSGIPEDTMQYIGNEATSASSLEEYRMAVEMMVEKSNYSFTPYMLSLMDPKMEFVNDSYYPGGEAKSSIFMTYGSGNLGGFEEEVLRDYERAEKDFRNDWNYSTSVKMLRAGLTHYPADMIDLKYSWGEDEDVSGWAPSGLYYWMPQIGGNDVAAAGNSTIADEINFLDGYVTDDVSYIRSMQTLYTQLPEGLQENLLTWWLKQRGFSEEDELLGQHIKALENTPYWQWAMTAYDVASTVQASGSYTKSPGRQPVNRDFVEYFLNERNEGYCVHYASATVTLLRAMGIPARYVEGYVVEGKAFNREYVANVPAENAHAWAEFWLPGTGWVPVESTPGGAAPPAYTEITSEVVEANTDIESTPESSVSMPEEEESKAAVEDDKQSAQLQNEKEEENSAKIEHIRSYLPLWVALIVVILAAALYMARYLSCRIRQKRFYDLDTNQAALNLYSHMEWLSGLGCVLPERAEALAMKARFSGHDIKEEELECMRQDLTDCENQLKKGLPAWKRFILFLFGVLTKEALSGDSPASK